MNKEIHLVKAKYTELLKKWDVSIKLMRSWPLIYSGLLFWLQMTNNLLIIWWPLEVLGVMKQVKLVYHFFCGASHPVFAPPHLWLPLRRAENKSRLNRHDRNIWNTTSPNELSAECLSQAIAVCSTPLLRCSQGASALVDLGTCGED